MKRFIIACENGIMESAEDDAEANRVSKMMAVKYEQNAYIFRCERVARKVESVSITESNDKDFGGNNGKV